jgi:hypothetical protein
MDFSVTDGPPTFHNENYAHFWLQDTVEAHKLVLDRITRSAKSDFGGDMRLSLNDHVCGTPLWVLAEYPPP